MIAFHVVPVDAHAALVGRRQGGEDADECRLAAAVEADDGDDLAHRHTEIDIVEGCLHGRATTAVTTEALAQTVNLDGPNRGRCHGDHHQLQLKKPVQKRKNRVGPGHTVLW